MSRTSAYSEALSSSSMNRPRTCRAGCFCRSRWRTRPSSSRFSRRGVGGQNDFAMMQEVLKRRFWKVRRETEGEGANEGTPDRQADHDTDREAVQAALRAPNAGALMTAPTGNGRIENRKPKTEREAG